MKFIRDSLINLIFILIVISFVVFYPMFISIYVFMPLMIGLIGFIMIKGFIEKKFLYMLVAFIYTINLELNLSLPMFLIVIAILIVYTVLDSINFFSIRCRICQNLISAFLIDMTYLALLMGYDFVFQTQSIVVDELLLYSLLVDMIVVVVL